MFYPCASLAAAYFFCSVLLLQIFLLQHRQQPQAEIPALIGFVSSCCHKSSGSSNRSSRTQQPQAERPVLMAFVTACCHKSSGSSNRSTHTHSSRKQNDRCLSPLFLLAATNHPAAAHTATASRTTGAYCLCYCLPPDIIWQHNTQRQQQQQQQTRKSAAQTAIVPPIPRSTAALMYHGVPLECNTTKQCKRWCGLYSLNAAEHLRYFINIGSKWKKRLRLWSKKSAIQRSNFEAFS